MMFENINYSNFSLGDANALVDQENFPNAFIETHLYTRVKNIYTNIITGTKGSGKSAYMLRLKKEYLKNDNFVIELKDQELNKFQDIFLNLSHHDPDEIDNLTITFTQLWDMIIIENIFHIIKEQPKFKKFKYKNDILLFFRTDKLNMVFDLIDETLKNASNAENIVTSFTNNVISMLKNGKVYNKAKSRIKEYLHECIEEDILIIIDDIDRYIENDNLTPLLKKQILRSTVSLYNALTNLTVLNFSKKIHIKACIPKDIFSNIVGARDYDKFTDIIVVLKWSKNDIRDLIQKRIEIALEKQNIERLDNINMWDALFGKDISSYYSNFQAPLKYYNRDRNTFDIIYEYTHSNPREIIMLCNTIIESTFNNRSLTITANDIIEGTTVYSQKFKRFFTNENRLIQDNIEIIIDSFANGRQIYTFQDFRQIVLGRSLALSEREITKIIGLLYNIGFIGKGIRKIVSSKDYDNITNFNIEFSYENEHVSINQLSKADAIIIHPIFIDSLNLSNDTKHIVI